MFLLLFDWANVNEDIQTPFASFDRIEYESEELDTTKQNKVFKWRRRRIRNENG